MCPRDGEPLYKHKQSSSTYAYSFSESKNSVRFSEVKQAVDIHIPGDRAAARQRGRWLTEILTEHPSTSHVVIPGSSSTRGRDPFLAAARAFVCVSHRCLCRHCLLFPSGRSSGCSRRCPGHWTTLSLPENMSQLTFTLLERACNTPSSLGTSGLFAVLLSCHI